MPIINEPVFDQNQRQATVCAGCNHPKQAGLVLCWNCFKGYNGKPAFKEYDGSLEEWVKLYHSN